MEDVKVAGRRTTKTRSMSTMENDRFPKMMTPIKTAPSKSRTNMQSSTPRLTRSAARQMATKVKRSPVAAPNNARTRNHKRGASDDSPQGCVRQASKRSKSVGSSKDELKPSRTAPSITRGNKRPLEKINTEGSMRKKTRSLNDSRQQYQHLDNCTATASTRVNNNHTDLTNTLHSTDNSDKKELRQGSEQRDCESNSKSDSGACDKTQILSEQAPSNSHEIDKDSTFTKSTTNPSSQCLNVPEIQIHDTDDNKHQPDTFPRKTPEKLAPSGNNLSLPNSANKKTPPPGHTRQTLSPVETATKVTPPSALKKGGKRTPGSSGKKVTYKDRRKGSDSDGNDKYWAAGESPKSPRRKSGRRQSKRRSSFVPGRISRSMSALPSSELCSAIPLDLPPEERLERLHRAALEYTLGKLSSEFPDLDGVQQFVVQARDAGEQSLEALAAKGAMKNATSKLSCQPNPANEAVENTIKTMQADLHRLNTERSEWERVLEELENKADDAQRAAKEVKSQPITEPPSSLSREQQSFLSGRLDLNASLEKVKACEERTTLAEDAIIRTVNLLKRFTSEAETVISEQCKQLYENSFGRDIMESPRKLLAARAAIPSEPSTSKT